MKPVAIFRFAVTVGPGYFTSFLDRCAIPWTLFKLDEGEAVPQDLAAFSGFALLGGPMSANDPMPWSEPILALIRKVMAADRPCLGHCLGGQLMSKALGGEVSRNPVKEIGWNPLQVDASALSAEWLGPDYVAGTTFQWHGETFTIPPGATRILTGTACPNQAFVIGSSLGMQCHTEMTEDAIESWCLSWAAEQADPALPSVQTPDEIRAAMAENMLRLRDLADRLYTRWIQGLFEGGNRARTT